MARETFVSVAQKFEVPWFKTLTIVASNDINEDTILSLNDQGRTFLGDSFSFFSFGKQILQFDKG